MALDWTDEPLARGLACYRSEEFFEAHEHWELAWLASPEPAKTFLQALIQTSAAFHHLRQGNPTGAASLLGRARRKLETYPHFYAGVNVQVLLQQIDAWRLRLDGQPQPEMLPFPTIR